MKRTTTALEGSKAVKRLVKRLNAGCVFHLAGVTKGARDAALLLHTFRANLVTTVNLLAALFRSGCRRVVLARSFEAMRVVDGLATSPYALSNRAAGTYGRVCWELFQVPSVNGRVFMTYGPGQRDRLKLIPYSTLCWLRGQPPRITDGARMVDWIYVDDVVEALLALAVTPEIEGHSIDLGTGRVVSVAEIVQRLARIVDLRMKKDFSSNPGGPCRHIDRADVERSERLLLWRPRVQLDEGLRRTVDYYRALCL